MHMGSAKLNEYVGHGAPVGSAYYYSNLKLADDETWYSIWLRSWDFRRSFQQNWEKIASS